MIEKAKSKIEAVFLGIDPAKGVSGAVILVPNYDDDGEFEGTYERVKMGVVVGDDQASRVEFIEEAIDEAKELKLPLVVAAENWTPGGDRMTFYTILGLGEGWGLWRAELLKTDAIVVRFEPSEWRELAFTWKYPKGREAVKNFAVKHIGKSWGFEVSEDIAEAACIAEAATVSAKVEKEIASFLKKQKKGKKK